MWRERIAHIGRSPNHIRQPIVDSTGDWFSLNYELMLAICIATHKRPVGLERLITHLQALTFARCTEPPIEIVVVDNDPAGSGASCARCWRNRVVGR